MSRLASSSGAVKPPSASNISPRYFGRASSLWVRLQVRLLMRGYAFALRMARMMERRARPLPPSGYDILLTGTFFSDNWVRSHLLPLAASDRCHRVRMVATTQVPDMPKVEGLYPPAWLMKYAGEVPARLLYFVWVAVRSRPDIVGGFHLMVNGLLAPLLGRLVRARSLYFCVGGPVEALDGGIWGGNRVFSRLGAPDPIVERRLLDAVDACDLVVTMGTGAIAFFRDRGLNTSFHVVSGGIDPHRFHPAATTLPEFDLIVTCRLVPVKRIDLFLRAVHCLVSDLPNVRAVIVGEGPLREALEGQARELGIEKNVTFVGQQAAVEDWLRRSRIFVLTSDSEGLSLSLMEAMMSGLPAVVSAVGDLGDLVVDGVNGYLVRDRSPEAFAEPLRRLLTDPEGLRQFSEAAARAGAANRPESVTHRWNAILSELGSSKQHRRTPSRALSRKNLWEQAPAPVKAALGSVVGLLPPHAIFGRRFTRQLRFLQDSQWWTEEKSRAYQLEELRKLCQHAQERTFYYREVFRAAGFDPRDLKRPEDLAALPTLDRETLQNRLAEMCAVPIPSRRVDYVSTGGSSGEPVRFYINSHRSSIEYAYLVSGWERAGFRLGTPLAVVRGRVVRANATGLHHEFDPLLRHHYYSSFHLTATDIPRYLDHIASIGPCFLHVYPSSIAAIARYLRGTARRGPSNVIGILAESEAVYAEDHALVQETFGCRYSASYGLTEKVVAASGCEKSANYHVWPTYGYFELLDAAGRQVTTPGARGEIVGTGFINKAVPFIRYRTGDYATYLGSRCEACGRAHPIITDIQGRRPREFLVAKDQSLIAWTALNMHDDSFDRVLRFQFRQDTPGRATLSIVPAEGFSAADAARIRRNLEEKCDGAITLTIETVESIRLSPAGKAIYVDQRLPVSV